MKKLATVFICFLAIHIAQAQNAKATKKKKTSTVTSKDSSVVSGYSSESDISNPGFMGRSSDHFMIQYGSDAWTNRPDSVRTSGFSRHFNFYIMLDKPFKTNPQFSVAYGLGIGSSNIFFDKVYVDLKSTTNTLPFNDRSTSGYHFSKFKVTQIFLEAPVELRFYSKPANPNHSWKFAVGAKVGLLLKSYTKGKDLQDKNGLSLYGPTYIEKESNKRFFTGTRFQLSSRIGYGNISLHGDYSLTPVIKSGSGPAMNSFSIGIAVSGL